MPTSLMLRKHNRYWLFIWKLFPFSNKLWRLLCACSHAPHISHCSSRLYSVAWAYSSYATACNKVKLRTGKKNITNAVALQNQADQLKTGEVSVCIKGALNINDGHFNLSKKKGKLILITYTLKYIPIKRHYSFTSKLIKYLCIY